MIPTTHFDETTSLQQLAETAQYWEKKARDAEERENRLLHDNTRLKAEFDDVTANAQRLAEILEASPLAYQTHVREALDARPGESVARIKEETSETSYLLNQCYGTIGLLTIEKANLQHEALDLAKDVDWFIRMQGSTDPGIKQVVVKATAFIEKHEEKEDKAEGDK